MICELPLKNDDFLLKHGRLLYNSRYTVATMSIFQITIGQCFYFPLGVGIACSTRVANLLGGGQPAAAKQASQAAILTGSCVLGCLFVLMQVMYRKRSEELLGWGLVGRL